MVELRALRTVGRHRRGDLMRVSHQDAKVMLALKIAERPPQTPVTPPVIIDRNRYMRRDMVADLEPNSYPTKDGNVETK